MPCSGATTKILEIAYSASNSSGSSVVRAYEKFTKVVIKIRRLRTREPTLLSAIEEKIRVDMRALRASCAALWKR
jgi:hypothetical protein